MLFITPHNKAVMSILCWLRRCSFLPHSHPSVHAGQCAETNRPYGFGSLGWRRHQLLAQKERKAHTAR